MLTDALKAEIQEAYRAWLQARGFRARRGQREMVAQVARTLTGDAPRILAVEAGTGTGKTAGYTLPAIPIARALGKSVIVSSATVALQEQVVLRDLPDLQRNAGIRFTFALAKGRGRYVCLKRLDDRLRYDDQQEIPLFDALTEDGTALYQSMLKAFADRSWDGELDSWAGGVDEQMWRQVTTDHRGCANNKCGFSPIWLSGVGRCCRSRKNPSTCWTRHIIFPIKPSSTLPPGPGCLRRAVGSRTLLPCWAA